MTFSETTKRIVLFLQIGFFGFCIFLGLYLWANGVRPEKAPEMKVTSTAEENMQKCYESVMQMPVELRDNGFENCEQIRFTDTLEPVSP